MIAAILTDARPALKRFLAARGVSGIVVAAAERNDPPQHLVLGADASGLALSSQTLFPVASVTKLATALAVLCLVDPGKLLLSDPLISHVPDAAAAGGGATLAQLMSHSAGFPAWLPDDAEPETRSWRELRTACLEAEPVAASATSVVYGNLGYGLLGVIIERHTGRSVAESIHALVLEPLGIEGYLGVQPPRQPAVIADVRSAAAGTDLDPLNSAASREVGAPWAGLVTTAAGALALGRAFLPSSGFLRPETSTLALKSQTEGLSGGFFGQLMWDDCPWGAGPELRGDKFPHWAPREASPDSYGHVGASGCVVWCDPRVEIAWAILGTRTYFNGWILRCGRGLGQRLLRG